MLREEIYPEDPSVFTIDTKFESFVFVNEVTVDVSCGNPIYTDVPRPFNVEVVPYNPN
jgi:hypothetical protein